MLDTGFLVPTGLYRPSDRGTGGFGIHDSDTDSAVKACPGIGEEPNKATIDGGLYCQFEFDIGCERGTI